MSKGIVGTIVAALLCAGLLTPVGALANDCSYWRAQIRQVARQSDGGNSRQQQAQQRQRNYLESQLAKCSGTTPGPIAVASGRTNGNSTYTPINPVRSTNPDAELQQLIGHCNRWIYTYNHNPSFENQSVRDTACRAATNREALLKNPTHSSQIKIKRGIKECIKPNNVVDDDVKACMQGTKEPSWKK